MRKTRLTKVEGGCFLVLSGWMGPLIEFQKKRHLLPRSQDFLRTLCHRSYDAENKSFGWPVFDF